MENIVNEIGTDYLGRPIIGINAANFGPSPNYNAMFEHIHTFLYNYANRNFVMVYFPQGLSYWDRPSIQKMSDFYKTIDHGVGKSMKFLFIIEPPTYYNLLLTLIRPFLNPKVIHKILLIPSLDELFSYFDLYSVNLPQSIRGTAETIVSDNKSIWFNTSLRTLTKRRLLYKGIPIILVKNVEYIENNGLDTVGLMRVPPLQRSFDDFIAELDENCSVEVPSIQIACSVTKHFFRSLKEPILPQSVFHSLTNFKNLSIEEKKQRILFDLQYMYPLNLACLEYLASLIDKIVAHSDKNQMNYASLGICLSPSLLWHTTLTHTNVLEEVNNLTHYVTAYFEHHKQLYQTIQ